MRQITGLIFIAKLASDGLGSTFDTFLEDNADKIKEFSERTDDDETLDKLDEVFDRRTCEIS